MMGTLFTLIGVGALLAASFFVCIGFGGLYFFIRDVTDADPPRVLMLMSIFGGVAFVYVLLYSPIRFMII